MGHKGQKEKILETIAELPQQMEAGDIQDFCSLAVLYSAQTPFSYKRVRRNSIAFLCNYELKMLFVSRITIKVFLARMRRMKE